MNRLLLYITLFIILSKVYLATASELLFSERAMTSGVFVIFLVTAALYFRPAYIAKKRKDRLLFLQEYVFPEALRPMVGKKYPHLDEAQLEELIEALRRFFIRQVVVDGREGAVIAMPTSVGVDFAWRCFSSIQPEYEYFCRGGYPFPLDYQSLLVGFPDWFALERRRELWCDLCSDEMIDPLFPDRLPAAFRVDRQLSIPGGMRFDLEAIPVSSLRDYEDSWKAENLIEEIKIKLPINEPVENRQAKVDWLVRKLRYYLDSESWLQRNYKHQIVRLFEIIESRPDLMVGLFGEYALLEERQSACREMAQPDSSDPSHPDYHPGCSSAVSQW